MTNSDDNSDKPGRPRKPNAETHGFFSKHFLCAWESPEELEKLEADLMSELKPDGCSEKQTVGDILRCMWNKLRVMKITQTGFRDPSARDPEDLTWKPIAELEYLLKIVNLESRIDSRINKAFGHLASLKEYKRIEASKITPKQLMDSPPIAPELSSSESNAANGDADKVEPDNPPVDSQPKEDTQ